VAYHPSFDLFTHNIKTQTTKFIKLQSGRWVCFSKPLITESRFSSVWDFW